MARAKAILQSIYPYNVSARCINKEWFNIPMPEVWSIFCDELDDASKRHNLIVHSFVLMANHFHLLVSTPDANISQGMHQFMGRTSRRLTRVGNRINETYAGRHFKCVLQHHNYYLNAYKYNYRNPVTAGVVERVEDYPFSTLPSVMGQAPMPFSMRPDLTYASDPMGTLNWLNTTPSPERTEAARYAFKRAYFQSKAMRNSNRPILTEDDIL